MTAFTINVKTINIFHASRVFTGSLVQNGARFLKTNCHTLITQLCYVKRKRNVEVNVGGISHACNRSDVSRSSTDLK